MGRKPVGAEPRSKYVGARITPAGRAQLESALRDGETESDFVRTAIRGEIARRAGVRVSTYTERSA